MLARPPVLPVLRPYVRLLWAGVVGPVGAPCLEHVLPTGCMHLAVRLSGPPLRLYAGADASAEEVGLAVIGGARAGSYLREAGTGGLGVGAQLEPGAARALFGAAASAFTGRHTRLEDAWGRHAQAALEQLHAARGPRECLDTLERLLLERLRPGPAFHPGVAAALAALQRGAPVAAAVRASGLSHRHLVLRFREAVGLGPKEHARVLRLQQVLPALARPQAQLADVAAGMGFADQAHLARDFRALTGLTPTEWRLARPVHAHHVPRRAAG